MITLNSRVEFQTMLPMLKSLNLQVFSIVIIINIITKVIIIIISNTLFITIFFIIFVFFYLFIPLLYLRFE